MIETTEGNLLNAPVEALVNTVNTVGIMGKGIALQFKQAYPQMFRAYENACKAGDVQLGKVHVFDMGGLVGGPRWIINTFRPRGTGALVAAKQIFKRVCKTWWAPSSV
jgi:O-acetyl-ADP-ribose deacetylase (regulator of RNase III)